MRQGLFELLCRVRVPAKPRVLDVFTHEALDLASALVGLKQRLAKHGSGDVGQVLVLGDGADLIPGWQRSSVSGETIGSSSKSFLRPTAFACRARSRRSVSVKIMRRGPRHAGRATQRA